MLEIASQMILCLLLAALLGFIIGYLFGKMTCANDDCGETTTSHNTHTSTTSHSHEAKNIATSHSREAQSIAAAASTTAVTANTDVEKTINTGTAPALLSGPRNGEKDNLSRIKGIGVKIEDTLNSIGIYHFDQIANWSEENIAWADSTLGFPGRAKRESWVAQAKSLAAGEETEFSKRVDAGKVASSKKA